MVNRITEMLGALGITIISCMCLTILASSSALSSESPFTKEFFIHYWWGPPTSTNLDAKYADVSKANFNYAGLPGEGDAVHPQKSKAILDACEANGIKYIVSDQRINPRILPVSLPAGVAIDERVWSAKKPDDPAFYTALDAVIADYANHPAFGGFYVVDEPSATIFPWIAKINQYLRKKLPDKIIYINLLPNWAPQWLYAQPTPDDGSGAITYDEYLEKFINVVKPQVLSYDNYALLEGNADRFKIYFANFEIVREKGLKYGIPTCFVFLSQGQPRPTATDMLWQANMALVYGFKGISYYTYWVWGEEPLAITYKDGIPTDKYREVKRINWQVKMLGPTLIKLTSTGVYHSSDVPVGCKPMDPKLPISIQSDKPIVLGMFKHEDGSDWAMIVNRDYTNPATTELAFCPSIKSVMEVSNQTGVSVPLSLKQGSASFVLQPGECKLMKLMK
ncbi:MAG: hypothetical protein ABFD54_10210 [Armatimonadota bacterium]|nr:hypothetical protein [bacterium]